MGCFSEAVAWKDPNPPVLGPATRCARLLEAKLSTKAALLVFLHRGSVAWAVPGGFRTHQNPHHGFSMVFRRTKRLDGDVSSDWCDTLREPRGSTGRS